MISPTGLGIRNDAEGFGYFDAPRGRRKHDGTDFLCAPGTEVVFPFDNGKILRIAYPYSGDTELSGVYGRAIERGKLLYFKMFYFLPRLDVLQLDFKQGDMLGVAQDVTVKYVKPGVPCEMKPHVHLEIDRIDPTILMEEEQ